MRNQILSENNCSSQINLLVVEDDPLLLDMLEDVLDSDNFKSIFVNSSDDALEQLNTGVKFDLLLTDHQLPGSMNGFELSVEASRLFCGIKVIITSGFNVKTVEPTKSDIDFLFIQKPYNPFHLKEKIEDIISA
jgi:DNA-binding NtrC family response regulator